MKSLSNQQKQLLFDYCIGLASQKESREAEALISCYQEAAELHYKLKSSIIPLESFKSEPCPDDLVEKTIFRLKNHVDLSQHKLKQLLSVEQERQNRYKSWFWGQRIAVAAVFVIIGTVCVSAYSVVLNHARQKSWRQQCQVQLQQIWQAMSHYSSDYDGKIPTIAATAGEPWWKVGYQGLENHSNTRPMWLLAKLGYIKPADFVCPGNCHGKKLKLNDIQVKSYNDFPAREYMAYSFQVSCHETASDKLLSRKVLMADY